MRIIAIIALHLLTATCVWGVESIKIVATLPEIAEWAKLIGGERVIVNSILEPDESPQTYAPRVKDVKILSGSRMVLKVGLNLEPWLDDLINSAGNDELEVIDLSSGVDLLLDKNNIPNSYIWLDPTNVAAMCENISKAFETVDVYSRDYYKKRLDNYKAKLKAVKLRAKGEVLSLSNRKFISYTPKWRYLSNGLGLEIAATIALEPGQEPASDDAAKLMRRINAEQLGVLAVEPGVPINFRNLIAEKSNVRIITLKPYILSNGPRTYLQLYEANVHALTSALRETSR